MWVTTKSSGPVHIAVSCKNCGGGLSATALDDDHCYLECSYCDNKVTWTREKYDRFLADIEEYTDKIKKSRAAREQENIDIGERFRALRLEKRMTMRMVSEQTGLEIVRYSRIENGYEKPTEAERHSLDAVLMNTEGE